MAMFEWNSRSRPFVVRIVRAGLWALAAVHVLESFRLRRRRERLAGLPALPDGVAPGTHHGDGESPEPVVVSVGEVDTSTVAEAAHVLETTEAEVVDLVPGDLPPEQMLRVLETVDPERLSGRPFASPGGPGEAMVLRADLAQRLGIEADGATAPPSDGGDVPPRSRLADLTVAAQRHASTRATIRIAPRLRSTPWTPADTWHRAQRDTSLFHPHFDLAPLLVGLDAANLAALTVGIALAPVPGLAALCAWSLQPAFVLAGHDDTAPAGTGAELLRASVRRLPRAWAETARVIAARRHRPPMARVAAPPPTAELFEERSAVCLWCGSTALTLRLETTDLFQYKPGTFRIDRCEDCGHVFQNPRLSPRGLDHYYDQFYDGLGGEQWERTFAAMVGLYEGRVDALASLTEPKSWLDIGCGHGHFLRIARERWPGARYAGLDMSESVLEAKRRHWIDDAHHGQFPELADELAGSFDVVSMNHYLEHTREPRVEIEAAARVLVPGGHLLIEGPDQASPWTRLGRYWHCWFQPQHQHFITYENLVAELERSGFEVVLTQRAEASPGNNLTLATQLLTGQLAGPPRLPWVAPASEARRRARPLVLAAMAPAIVAAVVADQFKNAWDSRPGERPGNAYRLVARRR